MFVSRKTLDSIYGTADIASPRPGPGVRATPVNHARHDCLQQLLISRHERLHALDIDVSKQRQILCRENSLETVAHRWSTFSEKQTADNPRTHKDESVATRIAIVPYSASGKDLVAHCQQDDEV